MHIRVAQGNYYPKKIVFPGGELNVTLPLGLPDHIDGYLIKTKIKSSEDLIELLLVKDAIDRKYMDRSIKSALTIAYLPYARQDRICNEGEALSVSVLARLINSMSFDRVNTLDNHSDVSTSLINNCVNITPQLIMSRSSAIETLLTRSDIFLCSPDAGAIKKTYKISSHFGGIPIIKADKVRDTKTGEITRTEVNCDDLKGVAVLVADDICDGGMTFIKLAEALKSKGAGDLFLYVTHGIFSKGLEPLSMYQKIFTTDSLRSVEDKTETLEIIKI